jgi:enterochelin esterase family protein
MNRRCVLPLTVSAALLIAAAPARAQQPPNVLSPEVHADRRVTFRLYAPGADAVRVTSMEGHPPEAMSKGNDGVWAVTVGPLAPEIYSYAYEIDGAPLTDPRNPFVKVWLQLNSLVEVPGDPPRLHEIQDVPHGVVHLHTYRSQALDQTRQLYVYTPPGYAKDGPPLPVVYLLHGNGDQPDAWTSVGRAHAIADNLIAQQTIAPLVIVMPYGHLRSPRFGPLTPEMRQQSNQGVRRDLIEDVMPLVESAYRITRDPERRAIVGLSMGGGQSLATGLTRLDLFRWIGAFSAAVPQGDVDAQFPGLKSAADAHLRLLWIACGRSDFLLERNEAFRAWLDERDIAHEYKLTEGGHEWPVWRSYLGEFLQKVFR